MSSDDKVSHDEKMDEDVNKDSAKDEKTSLENGVAHDKKVKRNGTVEDTTEVEKKRSKTEVTNDDEVQKNGIIDTAEGTENITKREDLTSYFEKLDHSVNQVHQSQVIAHYIHLTSNLITEEH